MAIPAGYKLAIIKGSDVVDTVDLEGYDLNKAAGCWALIDEIDGAIHDKASSASRQHFIETGSYLLKGEVESDG